MPDILDDLLDSRYCGQEGLRSRAADEIRALRNFLEIALDEHDDHFGKTNAERYPKNWDVQARRRLGATLSSRGDEK
jgi:hypothetical protein